MEDKQTNPQDQICKIFKLSNGETIICFVVKETPSYIEVETPFRLNAMYTPHGSVNIAIFKWDHTINYDQPIRVYKTSIVAVGDPDSEMYKNYFSMIFSSSDSEENNTDNNDTEFLTKELLRGFKSDKMH